MILLVAVPCWGTSYYIDNEWAGTKSGTFALPYDNIGDLPALSSGDNVYLRCGSSETISSNWDISTTNITIMAYWDSGGTTAGESPTGSAVLASSSPTYGSNCANTDAKPIVDRGNITVTKSGSAIRLTSTGAEVHSIDLRRGEYGVYINADSNIVRYCKMYNNEVGVQLGVAGGDGDSCTVEYNFIDNADEIDEDGQGYDCINLGVNAQSNTIQYNVLTGADHGAIGFSSGDNNIVQYNYMYSSNGHEDFCLGHNKGDSGNISRYNFCDAFGQAVEILGGQGNEIYGNILHCDDNSNAPVSNQACIDLITSTTLVAGGWDSDDNLIYNNTVYYSGVDAGVYGLKMVTDNHASCETTTIQGNYVVNNVFLGNTGEVFRLIDNCGSSTLANNYFYNNIGWGFEAGSYGVYLGFNKADADAWNTASVNHTNNYDTDPGLEDPASDEFWPSSSASNVYQSGYNVGAPYDTLLLSTSDFTASPPSVQTQQFATDYIGAYGLGLGAIYIDPDTAVDPGSQTGAFATPYDSWGDVTITAGNDYRQLCGTTWTGLVGAITAVGTSDNFIIIGAYYDNAGSPVHEDDSPSFGENCGNSDAKPILQNSSKAGDMFSTSGGGNSYIEFNSIKVQTVNQAFYINSSGINVRYCSLYDINWWGFKAGNLADSDDHVIEYNVIDLNDDGDLSAIDAVKLSGYSQDCTIRYNSIASTHAHSAIMLVEADRNTVEGNYIYRRVGYGDYISSNCIDVAGNGSDDNIIRYNYCKDAGSPIKLRGDNNEVYGNLFTGDSDASGANSACMSIQSLDSTGCENNKMYNNVCYNFDTFTESSYQHGAAIFSDPGDTGTVQNNEIHNNIFYTTGRDCIKVLDRATPGTIGTNYFYNNICYDIDGDYANIENVAMSLSTLNSQGYANDNLEEDPGLEDPASYEFWPATTGSAVYQSGYNVGDPYDTLLLSTSNFAASPPLVNTDQFANDYRGAYGLVGAGTPLYPIQGAAGNFKLN